MVRCKFHYWGHSIETNPDETTTTCSDCGTIQVVTRGPSGRMVELQRFAPDGTPDGRWTYDSFGQPARVDPYDRQPE